MAAKLGAIGVVAWSISAGSSARANIDDCRGVELDLVPSERLQIVAWVEDARGMYVDTIYITEATGRRGIGNRPGVMDMHSGPGFPFGSRLDVFPLWAHRHGRSFPLVHFQSGDGVLSAPDDVDASIDSPFSHMSRDTYFCRPIQPTERHWDALSCPSPYTWMDRGKLSQTLVSRYPPRADLVRDQGDHEDVEQFAAHNPFDTVSQATPLADVPARISWLVPHLLPAGDYVLRVEVSKEFDFNDTYTPATFPTTQTRWLEYGRPYRGQPAVLYEVPFTLDDEAPTSASTSGAAGYSALDGTLHPLDSTISGDTPGSGASRLRAAVDGTGEIYRVRLETRPERDSIAPGAPGVPEVTELGATSATFAFTAGGDDGDVGTASRYEIRYAVGDELDDATFALANLHPASIDPRPAGELQSLALDGLAPGTPYVVGIRAFDNCERASPLVLARFTTHEVDACGCTSRHPGGAAAIIFALAVTVRRRRRCR